MLLVFFSGRCFVLLLIVLMFNLHGRRRESQVVTGLQRGQVTGTRGIVVSG